MFGALVEKLKLDEEIIDQEEIRQNSRQLGSYYVLVREIWHYITN
jgi:hypothetical protein